MSDAVINALRISAPVALKAGSGISERERETILVGLVEALPGREAELASETLFHLRQQRSKQLLLINVLDAQRTPLKSDDGNGGGKA